MEVCGMMVVGVIPSFRCQLSFKEALGF